MEAREEFPAPVAGDIKGPGSVPGIWGTSLR
jgi:hypothetical protein